MSKKIKVQSTEASKDDSITYQQNVAGAQSPVLTKEVQAPYQLVLVNSFALRIDARDGSNNKIDSGTAVLGVSPPDDPTVQSIDDRDLRTYSNLSFNEQLQEDFQNQVQYEVEMGEFEVNTNFIVGVYLDADTQIDTGNSFVEFEALREEAE